MGLETRKSKKSHSQWPYIGIRIFDSYGFLILLAFSPLHVLRDHLREITGITSPSQVLILCDLTDPDRNRDVLLTAGTHDYQSLFECGIRDGSLLTLHPIGISRQIQRNQEANNQQVNEEEESDVYSVVTSITPAQADHSYNGVIFDIESRGPYETDIISFSFGGMLGRVV
jgi:hypothetical protein